MFKLMFLLAVIFIFKTSKAHAGPLFGGGDMPTYQPIAPETVMTEAQKAMQEKLKALGLMGYDQAMKYMDEDRFKRNLSFYDAAKKLIQTGVEPNIANIKAVQGEQPQPVAPPTVQPTTPTFATNDQLEQAIRYMDAGKGQDGIGGIGGYQTQMKMRTDPATIPVVQELAQGKITPEMVEAYKRQKQAAADAALLAKMGGR